jgi:hypothetical protein
MVVQARRPEGVPKEVVSSVAAVGGAVFVAVAVAVVLASALAVGAGSVPGSPPAVEARTGVSPPHAARRSAMTASGTIPKRMPCILVRAGDGTIARAGVRSPP